MKALNDPAVDKGTRIAWLDVLRSIAIISITVNHAVNRSFAINSGQFEEFHNIPIIVTVIKTILYAFSRIGVPLFVMISGALLLPRDFSGGGLKRFIRHNWLSLFVTTELWLAIMYWYKQILPGSILIEQGLLKCIVKFLMTLLFLNPITMGSMWYMEMILCVYLMIPILSVSLKKLDWRYFLIPCSIVLICSYILPDLNGVLTVFGYKSLIETKLESANVFSMYVVLLILGYYISNNEILKNVSIRIIALGMIASFVFFCLLQFWFYSVELDYVVGYEYKSIFPLFSAAFLFELIRRTRSDAKVRKLTERLAQISFGVYFVHICIMEGLKAVIEQYDLHIPALMKFVFLEFVSVFGAILIIELTKKNKWIARHLFRIK